MKGKKGKYSNSVVKQVVQLKLNYLLSPQLKERASSLTQVRLVTPSPLEDRGYSSLTQVRILTPSLPVQ